MLICSQLGVNVRKFGTCTFPASDVEDDHETTLGTFSSVCVCVCLDLGPLLDGNMETCLTGGRMGGAEQEVETP